LNAAAFGPATGRSNGAAGGVVNSANSAFLRSSGTSAHGTAEKKGEVSPAKRHHGRELLAARRFTERYAAMDLQTRVERLERQNRRMKHIGLVGLVVATLGFGLGAQKIGQPKTAEKLPTLQAHHFLVKDSQDRTRIWLGMRKDGPALTFYNEGQQELAVLRLVDGDASLVLSRAEGNQVQIGAATKATGITLLDERKVARAQLAVAAGADSVVTLWNASGQPTTILPAPATGPTLPGGASESKAEEKKANE
jgi:hypothetical protein